jgi:hypothetical protein
MAGCKSTISAGERPQTHALDCSAFGAGLAQFTVYYYDIKPIAIRLNIKT